MSSKDDALQASLPLEEKLERLDQQIYHQNKMQRTEYALQNTDKFSFRINHPAFQLAIVNGAGGTIAEVNDLHSPKLVEYILYEFRTGERVRLKFKYSREDVIEHEFKQAVDGFRESLVDQLHHLTGTKPYLEWGFAERTGKLSIWYSKEDFTSSKA